MQTFIDLISQQAKSTPDAIAITRGKKSISYGELFENMRRIHKGAELAGLRSGDNALFICKPDIEGLSLALGLLHAGITVSIIDPFTSDDLFVNRCKSAGITHVIAPALLYNLAKPQSLLSKFSRMHVANINKLEVEKLAFGSPFFSKSKPDAKKWLSLNVPSVGSKADEDSSAIIVFTSGTTSEPKGVVHSFKSLSVSIPATAEAMKIRAGIRVYSEPMTVGLVALSMGAEWIIPIPGEPFPDCEVWFATPKEILDGLDVIERSKVSPRSMETVAVGAAPVLPSLVDVIEEAFNPLQLEIKTIYGMTEMLPIAIGDAKLKKELAHLGDYIGQPLPTVEVKVADDGEVFISGPSLCKGYSPTPDSDDELLEVSPLGTGDIGEILPNGHLILKGRKKEMFIRGSMNVYPGLYEPALSSIEGVKQAVIVGIPDEFGDDEIVLAVLPLSSTDKESVKTRVLAEMHYHMDRDAIPSEVIMVDSLPVSGRANKLDRNMLLVAINKLRQTDG